MVWAHRNHRHAEMARGVDAKLTAGCIGSLMWSAEAVHFTRHLDRCWNIGHVMRREYCPIIDEPDSMPNPLVLGVTLLMYTCLGLVLFYVCGWRVQRARRAEEKAGLCVDLS